MVGGMTGLTGPVIIVFYLANVRDVARVRANTIVFLAALDVVIAVNLIFGGLASLLLGSVSHKVSQNAPCTCMTVK